MAKTPLHIHATNGFIYNFMWDTQKKVINMNVSSNGQLVLTTSFKNPVDIVELLDSKAGNLEACQFMDWYTI